MRVSIIMPVFNAERYLPQTIQSVLDQTHQDWELIAVDDGSTDGSLQILNSFADSRIKIIQQQNKGQCAATNTALQLAQGDYIQFLDADDLLDKDKIAVQVNALKQNPDCIAISRWAFFTSDIHAVKCQEEPIYISASPTDWIFQLWTHETMMPNNGYLIPKYVLEKGGKFYDEHILLNIDFEYFTRMALAANKIIFCNDAVCYYRKGITSAKTHKPSQEKRLSALQSRCKAIEYLLQKESTDRSKYAARMALTILTYSYPEVLPYSSKAIKNFDLGSFGIFGGRKFKWLVSWMGFNNAVKIKGALGI